MKLQNKDSKEKLIQRLRRVEGQIRGVAAMLEEERDCREILQQLSAARSAVQSASRLFLQEYAASCLMEMETNDAGSDALGQRQKREKIVQDMIALLDKAP